MEVEGYFDGGVEEVLRSQDFARYKGEGLFVYFLELLGTELSMLNPYMHAKYTCRYVVSSPKN